MKKECKEPLWALWILITIISVMHLIRGLAGWTVTIEHFIVPVWFSYLAFLVAGYFSYVLFRHLKK